MKNIYELFNNIKKYAYRIIYFADEYKIFYIDKTTWFSNLR